MSDKMFRTDKGQIIKKLPENEFHVEFGNVLWKLTLFQFKVLRQFIDSLDKDFFSVKNENTLMKREIRIPVNGTNLSIMLNDEELNDLRDLLFGLPDEFLFDNPVFNELYKISENSYDRFEKRDSIKIIRISCNDLSKN